MDQPDLKGALFFKIWYQFEKALPFRGVRLILRLKFGKMLLDEVRPIFFPAIA
jgi:hypothetical protein